VDAFCPPLGPPQAQVPQVCVDAQCLPRGLPRQVCVDHLCWRLP
jgi:hypothetical protein